jgi:hypothetical protein
MPKSRIRSDATVTRSSGRVNVSIQRFGKVCWPLKFHFQFAIRLGL